MAALYPVGLARIPVFGHKSDTSDLWKTTIGRKPVTTSQQSYHAAWLGLPILAGLVLVLALLWISWWLLALWLAGVGLVSAFFRGVARVNGRTP